MIETSTAYFFDFGHTHDTHVYSRASSRTFSSSYTSHAKKSPLTPISKQIHIQRNYLRNFFRHKLVVFHSFFPRSEMFVVLFGMPEVNTFRDPGDNHTHYYYISSMHCRKHSGVSSDRNLSDAAFCDSAPCRNQDVE